MNGDAAKSPRGAASALDEAIGSAAERLEAKVTAWRRDFHANPELGNREFRTAKIVADHLRALGIGIVGLVGTLASR